MLINLKICEIFRKFQSFPKKNFLKIKKNSFEKNILEDIFIFMGIRLIPTLRVQLGKCALIGQFTQYLEFIHVIELKGGQNKNFW